MARDRLVSVFKVAVNPVLKLTFFLLFCGQVWLIIPIYTIKMKIATKRELNGRLLQQNGRSGVFQVLLRLEGLESSSLTVNGWVRLRIYLLVMFLPFARSCSIIIFHWLHAVSEQILLRIYERDTLLQNPLLAFCAICGPEAGTDSWL